MQGDTNEWSGLTSVIEGMGPSVKEGTSIKADLDWQVEVKGDTKKIKGMQVPSPGKTPNQ